MLKLGYWRAISSLTVASAVLGLFAVLQWAVAIVGIVLLVAAALFALASVFSGLRKAGSSAGSLLSGPH